jgi:hypothetical protein
MHETPASVEQLYQEGPQLRREVLGAAYVDKSTQGVDEFMSRCR